MNDRDDTKSKEESKRNAILTERQKAEFYEKYLQWAFANIPSVAERLTPKYCKQKEARLLQGLAKHNRNKSDSTQKSNVH
ncbi:MAG: hypothetical protein SGI71_08705 [Verrucomicrobiota bacterium]|nr:hypothetical protein [Verrucomicrobiota bacterium]